MSVRHLLKRSRIVPLTIASHVGVFTYYNFFVAPHPLSKKASDFRRDYAISIPSFFSHGLAPLVTSAFYHEKWWHLLLNMAPLLVLGRAVVALAPGGAFTFSALHLLCGIGGGLSFISHQFALTIELLQQETPIEFNVLMDAVEDFQDAVLIMMPITPTTTIGNAKRKEHTRNVDEAEARSRAAAAASSDTSSSSSTTATDIDAFLQNHVSEDVAIPPPPFSSSSSTDSMIDDKAKREYLLLKRDAVIKAFQNALLNCPDAYASVNAVGLGASGVVFGMFTYIALLSARPSLLLYAGALVMFESFATMYPHLSGINLPLPHIYHSGAEVSDMPESTPPVGSRGRRHHLGGETEEEEEVLGRSMPQGGGRGGLPVVDPIFGRHIVIGHSAHVGGAVTGALIFALGRFGSLTGILLRRAYIYAQLMRRGGGNMNTGIGRGSGGGGGGFGGVPSSSSSSSSSSNIAGRSGSEYFTPPTSSLASEKTIDPFLPRPPLPQLPQLQQQQSFRQYISPKTAIKDLQDLSTHQPPRDPWEELEEDGRQQEKQQVQQKQDISHHNPQPSLKGGSPGSTRRSFSTLIFSRHLDRLSPHPQNTSRITYGSMRKALNPTHSILIKTQAALLHEKGINYNDDAKEKQTTLMR